MAGRRLLDVARIVQATRSVAKKHVALRSQQYEIYSKTSTLARAAKEQSDRVTLTIQAGIALARRLGETENHQEADFARTVNKDQSYASRARPASQHVAAQDSTTQSTAQRPVLQSEAQLRGSNQAASSPNVTNADSTTTIPQHGQSSPVNASDTKTTSINPDAFPIPALDKYSAHQSLEQDVPANVNINVFRTKKGASLLGNQEVDQTSRKEPSYSQGPSSQQVLQDSSIAPASEGISKPIEVIPEEPEKIPFQMRESRVPSTRIGRLWQYGGLGMSMAFGAVGETFRRATGGGSDGTSILLSPGNLEKLVARLSRMRGAALKLGQMISFQDMKMLPPPIYAVLQRVQDSADYMPPSQRDQVLVSNLGSDWRNLFSDFGEVPIAAASIGQVHKAVYRPTGETVAVKVQYPGVATSIDSDLNNLSILLTASKLLPKGLFLDKTIANARTELGWECDYIREAECAKRFEQLLSDDTDVFKVPAIISEASGKEVLTAEYMEGIGVTKLPSLSQTERDWIGTNILRLCLREMCEFNFMQTDPNWTNFLFNEDERKIELLDFGASRDYPAEFIKPYINLLQAASRNDCGVVQQLSVQLGYLTGQESKTMAKAHVDSVMTLSEPFSESAPEIYDFKDQTITDRVRSLIPVMLRERLAPPPEETYSLHRKLSGAFLLCSKLGSRVPCRELFANAMERFNRQ